jgi:antitoxin component YwqK of YwqJK toxin-antitoxin module
MKNPTLIIFVFLFFPVIVFTQDFGCYDLKNIDNNHNGMYARGAVSEGFLYKGDWTEFKLDKGIKDGFYREYHYFINSCTQKIRQEGLVKDGLKVGVWRLFIYEDHFFVGSFENGKKEGLWTGMYITEKGDTACFTEIEFENNLYNGKMNNYTYDGKLYKTTNYKNGLKHGKQIKYFLNDTSEVKYIRELKEYSKGNLHGDYLICNYSNPFDTLTYGVYSFGMRNSRFVFNLNNGERIIADYINDKLEGKLIKYHRNGVLAYELDYRNNLPYNLIKIQDSSGNIIETNNLKSGSGELNCYYDNGKLLSNFTYKNQLISGRFSRYYESGNIMEEGFLFTNNLANFIDTKAIEKIDDLNLYSVWQLNFAHGTDYTIYNKNGTPKPEIQSSFNDSIGEDIIICENYIGGKLVSKEFEWNGLQFGQINKYFEDGTIKMSGNLIIIDKDGTKISVKNGTFKYYHSNGKIQAVVNYSMGKEIGVSSFYDDSGMIKRKKVIKPNGEVYNIYEKDTVNRIDKNGKKQGKWIGFPNYYFSQNCDSYTPYRIEYYENDMPTGTWVYYDIIGENIVEEIVWEDSINSYSKRWDSDGKLIEEGSMTNKIKNGEWKIYNNKKGFLQYKGQYSNGKKDGVWQEFKRNGKLIRASEYIEGQIKNDK